MPTNFFCAGDLANAKVLVIGHDPRLQKSNTLADYAFFADYYFNPLPSQRSERRKYNLAQAVYSYVAYLTNQKYSIDQVVLSNLCNADLPHAPTGRTVYISEENARQGISAINEMLLQSAVEVIFPMSTQVNYWLQSLGFYPAVAEFMTRAKPKPQGVAHVPPYYEQSRSNAFIQICGKQYITSDGRSIVPILHIRNWPLKGSFAKTYSQSYESYINRLK